MDYFHSKRVTKLAIISQVLKYHELDGSYNFLHKRDVKILISRLLLLCYGLILSMHNNTHYKHPILQTI